jgi:hypothetical protein
MTMIRLTGEREGGLRIQPYHLHSRVMKRGSFSYERS